MENKEVISVLIADDDASTRRLLHVAMSQWGYQCIEAKDGEEAWKMMQQTNAPRILVVDWLMPGLTGIELCEKVKQDLMGHTYIILLTQQSGTENIIKGLEAGADEFLSKPFNMAELRSRLTIGDKIIRYENQITNQNETLMDCFNQIQTLIKDSLQKIASIEHGSENLSIIDVKHNQEKIAEIIKTFSPERPNRN